MCGIVAILSRPGQRPTPDVERCAAALTEAAATLQQWIDSGEQDAGRLDGVLETSEGVARELRGFAGMLGVLRSGGALEHPSAQLQAAVEAIEGQLDEQAVALGPAAVEALNAVLIRLKDAAFAIARDRVANVDAVRALAAGSDKQDHLRAAYHLNVALNALDRLEVRGRDSAGIHLYVRGTFGALSSELEADFAARSAGLQFGHTATRRVKREGGADTYSLVYKVAAEVGELGDNVAALRAAMENDALLQHLLATPGVELDLLAHTRWASVGVINEANAHPLNQELGGNPSEGVDGPNVVGALNGDVDNYQALLDEAALVMPNEITTDAKVIPALVSHAIARGDTTEDAFRKTVARFEGSVAIGAATADDPGRLYLALRGSGQALYVGLADDAFLVASEHYGIVEETAAYVRMDGETPADPADPSTRGQVIVLDSAHAGTLDGITRLAYDGTPLPVTEDDLGRTEVTTRDIDRGAHRHYLHKEISESPDSVRKTLRGHLVHEDGRTLAVLGDASIPPTVREALSSGRIRRIRVIGQGTAAVAGVGVADAIRSALSGAGPAVDALPATEVSGFHLRDDMSDELFIAISQSGTTTDTNRTVDLLRARGASVLGIVNRRGSDLTERVDGIVYTSDGRDVEMSVASTKAFYSQITAGFLMADAIARLCAAPDEERRSQLLQDLEGLPTLMRELLAREDHIAQVAARTAPPRRYWALVGNGRNLVAAEEIRIKLSELCYKSIACDSTEDKKHIDLSSEPLILICAAGLRGSNASDVGKEVEIYAAHKACPVVITSDSGRTWRGAAATIEVPDANTELAFVLSTMAGHLYGYHAARAIDALALPLREARGRMDVRPTDTAIGGLRRTLRRALDGPFQAFAKGLRAGQYDGALDAGAAAGLSLLFRYATDRMPLESFVDDYDVHGTPATVAGHLAAALTAGIDDLSRPIDAIKHQAKTVTVGISRSEEALFDLPLVRAVLETGAARESLPYDEMRVLQALDVAVEKVLGYTRYVLKDADEGTLIRIESRGGISDLIKSRTDEFRKLRGTKNTVAQERRVLLAVGLSDARPILLVPEVRQGRCIGIVLLHIHLAESLDATTRRTVLTGYRDRYGLIRDAITETNTVFSDEHLDRAPLLDLLTQPVLAMTERLLGTGAS